MNWLLSILFPPRLPGKVRDWHDRVEYRADEQGWAGNVREHYRDAIQRHWGERAIPVRLFSREYLSQIRHAEIEMAAIESNLVAQGFVNTIHDCWEKKEDYGPHQRLTLMGPPKK